ncbi:VWA domain-containing protein [Haloarcula marismortui]|uniref:VWA domain-containing protein n=1 Tax=Haloarcula marismortui ATCC 33800 TaxID=662476 RepID=M0JQJ5_9EURY|nr:VWA domain-containing protein [Haloarcula sinaiiensis]EMA11266.1 hypothetical protein C436_15980 [Haloarcula sinaiiensis ATCC 33800]QUJ73824.1 VWA domain-containing protein [Haloarcula sinaiiensis ATCC 33800]
MEEIYDRQPFADGVSVEDIDTRNELAQSEYDHDFRNLSDSTKEEIEGEYDAQFADSDRTKNVTRDEIAQEKYGENFADLSNETTREVEEIWDRQPFVSFSGEQDPAKIHTRDEIAQSKYGYDFENLSILTQLEVEDLYDQQFPISRVKQPDDGEGPDDGVEEPEVANFQITGLNAPDVEQGDTANVTASIENTGDAAGTQTISLMVEDESVMMSSEEALDAGESKDVMFNVGTSNLSPGTYNVTTTTANDTATTTLTVTEDDGNDTGNATFEVTSVNAPDTEQGNTANVTATIENAGNAPGTQNVSLVVEGENISTGTGAVDIVFVVDESGSMEDDIDTVRNQLQMFSQNLESENVNAQYAVVTLADQVVVQQNFTSNVSATNQTLDELEIGGATEYNYDAIQTANDLDGRESAKRVLIDLTDEDSDTQSGTPSQQALSNQLNATNTTYIAVTPNATELGPLSQPELQKRPLANMTASGQWYDLLQDDFGERFRTDIAQTVIDVTKENAKTVSLDAGDSTQVTFQTNTSDLPPSTYNVTVSTEDDSGSTTLTVTS